MFEKEIYNIIAKHRNGVRRRVIADEANVWVADTELSHALGNLLASKKIYTTYAGDAANMEKYLLYHAFEFEA